jgi:hypothetical protein
MAPKKLPKFASEAEEARWLFNHRDELAQDMVGAIRSGHSEEGSRGRALRRALPGQETPESGAQSDAQGSARAND